MSDMYDKKSRLPLGQKFSVRENGTLDVSTPNDEPTLTQQQFAAECDVNNIMKKYEQTGELYHVNRRQGVYADMAGFGEYRDMLHAVMDAKDRFESLPAEVRKRFGNDPGNLIDFLSDSKNTDEAISLGLVDKIHAPDLNQPPKTKQNSKQNKTGGVSPGSHETQPPLPDPES